MKIWILNPPYFQHFSRPQRSPAVTKSGTVYYPIWLASCAGVLERAGHEVRFTDAPARGYDLETILETASAFDPGLIVMDTSTPSINNDLAVCTRIRQVLPHVFLVLVGTHVSALAGETLARCPAVNAVARREYERTIEELAAFLSGHPAYSGHPDSTVHHDDPERPGDFGGLDCDGLDRNGLSRIQGLSFQCQEPGNDPAAALPEVIHNPDRPFIKDLDSLPWVSRVYQDHLCLTDYFNPNARFPMVTLMTSRGCPFRCRFCVYPQTLTGRRFRFRSVEDVVRELRYIQENLPSVKAVFFEDDTLSASKKRCMALCRAMIQAGIRIPWTTNSRIDPDLETLTLMKQAGCQSLCVGFESGSQRILDGMGKGIQKEDMFRFMEHAKKAGILVHGCFMVGFPGETRSEIEQTICLAMDLKPDTAQFYPVMVYPGTEAYEQYREKNWITAQDYDQWLTPQGLHNCVVRNETLTSEELVRICDDARRRFYLRPGYVAYKLRQIVTHPSQAVRTLKAFKTFFKHLLVYSHPDRG